LPQLSNEPVFSPLAFVILPAQLLYRPAVP